MAETYEDVLDCIKIKILFKQYQRSIAHSCDMNPPWNGSRTTPRPDGIDLLQRKGRPSAFLTQRGTRPRPPSRELAPRTPLQQNSTASHQQKFRALLSTSFFSTISPAKYERLWVFHFCEVVTRLLEVHFWALPPLIHTFGTLKVIEEFADAYKTRWLITRGNQSEVSSTGQVWSKGSKPGLEEDAIRIVHLRQPCHSAF